MRATDIEVTSTVIGKKKISIGDKLYIPGSMYVYRGQDDIAGGLAEIDSITHSNFLPKDHFNYVMVGFKGIPNKMYNMKNLIEQQDKLAETYAGHTAHPDPDMSPEFNCPDADWIISIKRQDNGTT